MTGYGRACVFACLGALVLASVNPCGLARAADAASPGGPPAAVTIAPSDVTAGEPADRRAELEREIGKLDDRFLQLERSNRELKADNDHLRQKLRVASLAARGFSRSIARRTFNRVSRHIAAAGGAAVPYVGAGVISGMARLDARDACELLEELNELNRALDLEPAETSRLCTMQIPTSDQILAQVLANWRTAYAISAAWANQYQAVLPQEPPVVPHAGANDLWMAVFGVNPSAGISSIPRGPAAPTAPLPPVSPLPPGARQP